MGSAEPNAKRPKPHRVGNLGEGTEDVGKDNKDPTQDNLWAAPLKPVRTEEDDYDDYFEGLFM